MNGGRRIPISFNESQKRAREVLLQAYADQQSLADCATDGIMAIKVIFVLLLSAAIVQVKQ